METLRLPQPFGPFSRKSNLNHYYTASPVVASGSTALYYKVNVEGTRNLIECAGKLGGVKAFVYTSSAAVVHDSVSDLMDADERLPVL